MNRRLAASMLIVVTLGACSYFQDPEEAAKADQARAKEIERRQKDSIPKTQQIALAQKVDPALVKRAQQALAALKEYMDEPSGKVDMVTVNAVEAFQRRLGVEENGLLSEDLVKQMESAAPKWGHSSFSETLARLRA
jgi:peptidoglycan hydrolase-like protein with peptidoglycan-binding domain